LVYFKIDVATPKKNYRYKQYYDDTRLVVFTAMNMKVSVFWVVTLCSDVVDYPITWLFHW